MKVVAQRRGILMARQRQIVTTRQSPDVIRFGNQFFSCSFKNNRDLHPLCRSFQGALQGLIQGGLRRFILLLRDAALLVLHFEFEQFVL